MALSRSAVVPIVCLMLFVASSSLALANPVFPIHTFVPTEGGTPHGDLTLDGTALYGASQTGGILADSRTNSGTVYKVNLFGDGFQVLHSFENANAEGFRRDGSRPQGGMRVVAGNLHGVTASGGPQEGGTYFRVGTDGTGFKTTSQFTIDFNSSFGSVPNGDLNYGEGTTRLGGSNSNGVLISARFFPAFSMPDGAGALEDPVGATVIAGTNLFGMANDGGAFGNGGIFKINNANVYEVLHSFAGGADGTSPTSTMKVIDSKIYGTTASSLFSMNHDGSGYQVLSSDAGGSNITHVGARLYGARGRRVWEIGLDGNDYQVLHEGTAGDGFLTTGGLTFVDLTSSSGGTWLYGVARESGVGSMIYAMPFEVVPVPEPQSLVLAGLAMATLAGYGWHTRRLRK